MTEQRLKKSGLRTCFSQAVSASSLLWALSALLLLAASSCAHQATRPELRGQQLALDPGLLLLPLHAAGLRVPPPPPPPPSPPPLSPEQAPKKSNTKKLPPYYHTSDAVDNRLREIARQLSGVQVTRIGANGTEDVLTLVTVQTRELANRNATAANAETTATAGEVSGGLRGTGGMARGGQGARRRSAVLIFGEHAREVITVETALQLVENVAAEVRSPSSGIVGKLLATGADLYIVPNVNPRGRRLVEDGAFCRRTNEHGVDLNRNWGEEWRTAQPTDHAGSFSGPFPFSEVETRCLRDLVNRVQPSVFVTVHSGAVGMYTPFASDDESQETLKAFAPQLDDAAHVLNTVNEADVHCDSCHVGPIGRELGMNMPGTCLDYIFRVLNVPFSVALEIFRSAEGDGGAFVELGQLGESKDSPPGVLQGDLGEGDGMTPAECLGYFNPLSAAGVAHTTQRWANAIADITQRLLVHAAANDFGAHRS